MKMAVAYSAIPLRSMLSKSGNRPAAAEIPAGGIAG
jgi:hypothetical protein